MADGLTVLSEVVPGGSWSSADSAVVGVWSWTAGFDDILGVQLIQIGGYVPQVYGCNVGGRVDCDSDRALYHSGLTKTRLSDPGCTGTVRHLDDHDSGHIRIADIAS